MRSSNCLTSAWKPNVSLWGSTVMPLLHFPDPKGIAFGIQGIGEIACRDMCFGGCDCATMPSDFFQGRVDVFNDDVADRACDGVVFGERFFAFAHAPFL